MPLPGNAYGIALQRLIECGCLGERSEDVELPAIPGVLDTNTSPKNGHAMRGKNQNRPIARGKRHLNFNRGNYNNHRGESRFMFNFHFFVTKIAKPVIRLPYFPGQGKPRKPRWMNDGDCQWAENPLPPPPPPLILPRPPKYWHNNPNNQRYSGPPLSQPSWNDSFNETNYCQSDYADFDHVGGPMRKNQRFPKKRPTPY